MLKNKFPNDSGYFLLLILRKFLNGFNYKYNLPHNYTNKFFMNEMLLNYELDDQFKKNNKPVKQNGTENLDNNPCL